MPLARPPSRGRAAILHRLGPEGSWAAPALQPRPLSRSEVVSQHRPRRRRQVVQLRAPLLSPLVVRLLRRPRRLQPRLPSPLARRSVRQQAVRKCNSDDTLNCFSRARLTLSRSFCIRPSPSITRVRAASLLPSPKHTCIPTAVAGVAQHLLLLLSSRSCCRRCGSCDVTCFATTGSSGGAAGATAAPAPAPAAGGFDMSKNPKPGDESASPGVPGLGSSGFSTATMSAPAPKFSFGVQPSGGKKRAIIIVVAFIVDI